MSAPTSEPAETLIRQAWDIYEQDRQCERADDLRAAVWALEESVDYGRATNVEALARRVVRELTTVTGDEVDEILAPMPTVAEWLGLA
ncbi:hypothetical protein QEN35_18800 [Gordonia alkanivorans]|uniref:hypothetical protein n=1 Tax=Gordonia alkanivorans TaxID=84096 RepID=UPI0024472B4A|nr:hypothetical protein [Gordonia alkanivorans]MDH3026408.1 hypothetical protein [Gordonia alkanivorans]